MKSTRNPATQHKKYHKCRGLIAKCPVFDMWPYPLSKSHSNILRGLAEYYDDHRKFIGCRGHQSDMLALARDEKKLKEFAYRLISDISFHLPTEGHRVGSWMVIDSVSWNDKERLRMIVFLRLLSIDRAEHLRCDVIIRKCSQALVTQLGREYARSSLASPYEDAKNNFEKSMCITNRRLSAAVHECIGEFLPTEIIGTIIELSDLADRDGDCT